MRKGRCARGMHDLQFNRENGLRQTGPDRGVVPGSSQQGQGGEPIPRARQTVCVACAVQHHKGQFPRAMCFEPHPRAGFLDRRSHLQAARRHAIASEFWKGRPCSAPANSVSALVPLMLSGCAANHLQPEEARQVRDNKNWKVCRNRFL